MDNRVYVDLFSRKRDQLQDCTADNEQTCRHCAVRFTVDEATHLANRRRLQQKKEFGGSMHFDFGRSVLVAGQTDSGKYNSIAMTRGGVDWHSHPALCLNDDTCALGVPSPADFQNIALGSLFGTVAHMVYAREGTYVVQAEKSLLRRLQSSVEATRLFFADVDRVLSDMHKKFVASKRQPYHEYSKQVRQVARRFGFRVKLFKGNRVPVVQFRCLCGLLSSKQLVKPVVAVPSELENAFI